jgi:hypothetical protein
VEDPDEGFIGADWDDFAADIPWSLRAEFAEWSAQFEPSVSLSAAQLDHFHAEGRRLSDELASVLGQSVEYRP